mgnify:CR=1 FL=1
MSIELWAARLERPLTERETEAMLPLLPPERQERLLRIKQSEKRREPCAPISFYAMPCGSSTAGGSFRLSGSPLWASPTSRISRRSTSI